jgi:hypothetical protein
MNKNYIAQVVYIIIILIAVISINLLLMLLSIPVEHLSPYPAVFAAASFVMTVILGGYHLSTMVRRKRRKTDAPFQPAAA